MGALLKLVFFAPFQLVCGECVQRWIFACALAALTALPQMILQLTVVRCHLGNLVLIMVVISYIT